MFVDDFLSLLVRSKAMALFGMLFAIGLAIQMERKEARGDGGFWAFAWRRMGALVAIGLLHVVLLWEGDILITYALAGILLFPFLRRKTRTIHIWIGVLVGVTLAMIAFSIVRRAMGTRLTRRERRQGHGGDGRVDPARATAVMGHGTWWEVLLFRLQEWSETRPVPIRRRLRDLLQLARRPRRLALRRPEGPRGPPPRPPSLGRMARGHRTGGLRGGALSEAPQSLLQGPRPMGCGLLFPLSVGAEFGYLLLALGYGALILLAWQSILGEGCWCLSHSRGAWRSPII